MKSIGIKLADGSFYPLLEEGNPEKRTLDLTTVMDNQTKVQVEVYRTDTGTMENAEYLDTLEIKNLKPHENGEPTLCLAIDVDENNELSAEIRDPETGRTSEIQVTLQSRTMAGIPQDAQEEDDSSDVIISDEDLEKAGLDDFMEKKEFESEEIPLPAEDFSFDDVNEPATADDTILPQDENADEEIFGDTSLDLPDFGTDDGETFVSEDELKLDDTEESKTDDSAEIEEEKTEDIFEDLGDVPLDDIDETEVPIEEAENSIEEAEDSEDSIEETDASFEESLDLPSEESEDTTEDTLPEESPSDEIDFKTDLPDFDEDNMGLDSLSLSEEDKVTEDFSDMNLDDPMGDGESAVEDSAVEDLSLPDFDDLDSTEENTDDIFGDSNSDLDTDLQLPDFDDLEATDLDAPALTDSDDSDSFFDLPDFDDGTNDSASDDFGDFTLPPDFDTSLGEEKMNTEQPKNPTFAPSNSLFSNLYDKETLEGSSSNYEDGDDVKKKTKAPVVICIICAIICILAALFSIFGFPSKFSISNITSLFTKNQVQDVEEEIDDELPEPEAVIEKEKPSIEVEIVQQVAPAKEDTIVVAETPAAVVPAEPEKAPEKIPDIRYKIVWGDTLWDISTAYYKTPWKYKRLAKYNKIKNPDRIIAGKYILIPAE